MGRSNALTPQEREAMIALHKEGGTVASIATASGRSQHTVSRVLTGKSGHSQYTTDQVHRGVGLHGPFSSLQQASDTLHYAQSTLSGHLAYLREQGYVEERWGPGPTGHPSITFIGLTHEGHQNIPMPKGTAEPVGGSHVSRHPGDGTDFRNQPSRAPGGKITVRRVPAEKMEPPIVLPKPTNGLDTAKADAQRVEYEAAHPRAGEPLPKSDRYPLLTGIIAKSRAIVPLREAARALEKGDPLLDALLKRIDQMGGLTPLEQEYRRYAEDRTGEAIRGER